jgi:hypothetical protein
MATKNTISTGKANVMIATSDTKIFYPIVRRINIVNNQLGSSIRHFRLMIMVTANWG